MKLLGRIIVILACYWLAFYLYQNNSSEPLYSEILTHNGDTDGNLIELLDKTDTLVIQMGDGGYVLGMINTLSYLRQNPNKVVIIDGECYSACTMLLNAPNVYITSKARLFFHSSSTSTCVSGKLTYHLSDDVNNLMLIVFEQNQMSWIIESKAFSSLNFVELPADKVFEFYGNRFVSNAELPQHNLSSAFEVLSPDYWSSGDCFSLDMMFPQFFE